MATQTVRSATPCRHFRRSTNHCCQASTPIGSASTGPGSSGRDPVPCRWAQPRAGASDASPRRSIWARQAVAGEPLSEESHRELIASHTASVSVDIPPCEPDVPPTDPVPPLAAPQFLSVATQCADPALFDGRADFVVNNANYQFLGGTGDLYYDWTLSSTSAVMEEGTGYYFATSGIFQFVEQPLAPDSTRPRSA